jgi:hypothetical protein
MANQDILTILEQRLGRRHARQRLGIEKDHEAQVFGQGLNFFHIEKSGVVAFTDLRRPHGDWPLLARH